MSAPPEALEYLKQNPHTVEFFKKKYGYIPAPKEAEEFLIKNPSTKDQFKEKFGYLPDLGEPGLWDHFKAGVKDFVGNQNISEGIQFAQKANEIERIMDEPEAETGFAGALNKMIRLLPDPREGLPEKIRDKASERLVTGAALKEAAAQVKLSDETLSLMNSESFDEAWDKFLEHPVKIGTELTSRSGANMVPVIAAGAAGNLIAGPPGGAVMSGLSSGRIEYVNTIIDGMMESGVDLKDRESVDKALNNKELMAEVREKARKRSMAIGALDALSFGLASKTLAPKALGSEAARQAMNVPVQAAVQAGAGAGGEALAEISTEGKVNPGEVLAEGAAELTFAPVEVASAVASSRKPKADVDLNDILDPEEFTQKNYEQKAKEFNLSKKQIEAFRPRAETDHKTGYYGSRELMGTIERAEKRAAKGEEAHYVEADFANMGGGNKHKGSNEAFDQEFFIPATKLLREEIEAIGGEVVPGRMGGDEVGFVIVGATEEQISGAMDKASQKISQMAKDQGMGDIPNPKYPGSKERGINLYYGIEKIVQGDKPKDVRKAADTKVNLQKLERNEDGDGQTTGEAGSASLEGQAPGIETRTPEADTGAGENQGAEAGDTGDSGLDPRPDPNVEQTLAGQFETRDKERVESSDLPPAAQGLIDELDDPGRVDFENLSPEQLQSALAARELLADRETGKYAGNTNLNRIQSSQDLDKALTAIADTFQSEVVPHEQVIQEAKSLGLEDKDVLRWDRKEGITREKVMAARMILMESGNDLVAKAKQAITGDVTALMAFKASLERHNGVMAKVSGMTKEAGRILNQFNITAEASKGSLKAIENIMSSSGDKLKLTAELMSTLDDPAKINKYAKDAFRAKTTDVIIEAWINALLSGPQTHVVNITSNTLASWLTTAEHYGAAGISKVTGGEITFKEARARQAGWLEGALEGIIAAGHAFIHESTTDMATKLEQGRHKAISAEALGLTGLKGQAVDVMGQVARLPGRFLLSEDEFFKAIGYRQEINALAMRKALNEGLKGDELSHRYNELRKEPTDEMKKKAEFHAEYQTFTNPLGPFGRKIQQIANQNIFTKLIAPFVRTPLNIVKFAGERSPLFPLMDEVRSSLRGNGPVEREVAMARIAMGGAIWGSTAYLISLGLITGGGPDEPEEKARYYDTGWQPYSIKIGDKYHAYNRIEPLGILMGTLADAVEIWDRATQSEQDEMAALIVTSSIGAISENLLSKTWLKGLSDAVLAVTKPSQYANRWFESISGTVVPTAVAQVARTNDPYLRRVEGMMDSIKSRIPGQREKLLPKLNLWGDTIKLGGGVGPDILSPIYTSLDKKDLVEEEMIRLEIFPRMPLEKLRGVKLTPELHNEYIQLAGRPAKQFLNEIVNNPEYKNMPDFAKKELIRDTINEFRDAAGSIMLARHPDIFGESVKKKLEAVSQ